MLQRLDAGALFRHSVEEFQRTPNALLRRDARGHSDWLDVRADPEALAHATWNRLDNSVRLARRTLVRVACRSALEVVISVPTRPRGIPAREQKESLAVSSAAPRPPSTASRHRLGLAMAPTCAAHASIHCSQRRRGLRRSATRFSSRTFARSGPFGRCPVGPAAPDGDTALSHGTHPHC